METSPLSSEGSLTCHTHCDTGLPFIMAISEDPWHSHLLPSVWHGSCHYLFLRLRSVATGDLPLRHRGGSVFRYIHVFKPILFSNLVIGLAVPDFFSSTKIFHKRKYIEFQLYLIIWSIDLFPIAYDIRCGQVFWIQ